MGNRRKKKNSHKPNTKPKASPVPNIAVAQAEGSNGAQKTQMHHYVPRWVLRHFRDGSADEKEQDSIWCYQIETGELKKHPIAKAYAEKDLYKDMKNPLEIDVWGIEKKLSELEGHASKSVSQILTAVKNHAKNNEKRAGKGKGPTQLSYTLSRKWLNYLRKFMFVMYYHQSSIASTYFDEDHPDNAQVRSWIKAFRERENLSTSPLDVWLHVLKYYLFTSHTAILAHGNKVQEKLILDALAGIPPSGFGGFEDATSKEVDPDLKNWEAVSYSSNMEDFYLAIWEAAPGFEFVMSNNSFGLYEGWKDPVGALHKIYVVSPKIVLVLCHVALKPEGFNIGGHTIRLASVHFDMSMLLDAPHDPPKVTYSKIRGKGPFSVPVHCDEDCFEYNVSTLTPKDTHTINAIILGNAKDKGMITFSSKAAALSTLDAFGDNYEFDDELKFKYAPLVKELLEETEEPSSFNLGRFTPPEHPPPNFLHQTPGVLGGLSRTLWGDISLRYQNSRSPAPGTLWEVNFEIYCLLHEGHKAGDWHCTLYEEYEDSVIQSVKGIFRLTEDKSRPAQLVKSMNDVLATSLFGSFQRLLLSAGIDLRTQTPFEEQVIIGLMDWILKNKSSFFDDLENHAPTFIPRPVKIKEYIDLPEQVPTDIEGNSTTSKVVSPCTKPQSYLMIAAPPEEILSESSLIELDEYDNLSLSSDEPIDTEESSGSLQQFSKQTISSPTIYTDIDFNNLVCGGTPDLKPTEVDTNTTEIENAPRNRSSTDMRKIFSIIFDLGLSFGLLWMIVDFAKLAVEFGSPYFLH